MFGVGLLSMLLCNCKSRIIYGSSKPAQVSVPTKCFVFELAVHISAHPDAPMFLAVLTHIETSPLFSVTMLRCVCFVIVLQASYTACLTEQVECSGSI